MNSGKEVRNAHEQARFDKFKQKVIDALSNDPFGLNISQLTTICQLSTKAVKQVLSEIDVSENFAGTYTLKGHVSPDLSANRPQPAKQEPKAMQHTEPKITFKQQMINMFKANPDGVTLERALEILKCDRVRFDGTLCHIKKTAFPVEFNVDGSRLYVPKFDVDQTLPVQAENEPVAPVDLPTPEPEVVQISENEPENVPVVDEYLPPKDEESALKNEDSAYLPDETTSETPEPEYSPPSNDVEKQELLDCKGLIQKQTFSKSEVYLDKDQLTALLQQLFDLDDVKWKTTGSRVDGVHLSKVEFL